MESEGASPPSQSSPILPPTEPTSHNLRSQNLFLSYSFQYFTPAYAQISQDFLRRGTLQLTSQTKCTADINATKHYSLYFYCSKFVSVTVM
jgi:hypothetical protein